MLRVLDRGLGWLSWVGAALVIVLLFAGPSLVGAKKPNNPAYGAPATPGAGQGATQGSAPQGSQVFASAGCAGCHTLKAAGASGSIGPNLDQVRPTASAVSAIVRSGSGAMPSFAGKLSDPQIAAVSSYVASVAGR